MISIGHTILNFAVTFLLFLLMGSWSASISPRPVPRTVLLCVTYWLAFMSLAFGVPVSLCLPKEALLVTFTLLVVAAAAAGRYWIGNRARIDWSSWKPGDTPCAILCAALVAFQVLMFVNALAPYVNQDAESSHWLFLRQLTESGRFVPTLQNPYSYYPLGMEMAVAFPFTAGGPEAANLSYWLMQVLLMGWLIDWGARRGRPRSGYLLAAAVCGLYYWPVIAYSGYVDGGVALFSTAGVITYFEWLEKSRKKKQPAEGGADLRWAGLFIGTACASKYSALPLALLVILHLLWLLVFAKSQRREMLRGVAGFILMFIIPVLPWYGRNLVLTGNPVFPFMRGIFGGPEASLADDVATWATWGLPISLRNYVLYPLKLSWFYEVPGTPFVRLPYLYMTWLFALSPVAGVLLLHRRTARIAAVWCFAFFTFAFFFMNLQTRYFLSFTILALWLVVEWLELLLGIRPAAELEGEPAAPVRHAGMRGWIAPVLVGVPLAMQLGVAFDHFQQRLPYLSGKMTREQYIEHVWPSFAVFNEANRLAGDQAKVCVFSLRTYWLNSPYEFPPDDVFQPSQSPADTLERMRQRGLGYVLVESRVRRAGALFSWMLEQSTEGPVRVTFDEAGLLDAAAERDVSRGLARELLRHQGGRRVKGDDGVWRWEFDLAKFGKPSVRGMLEFLGAVPELRLEGRLRLVKASGEWELYELR